MTTNPNQKNGVTLIELLTVVGILAVLFALLVPQVRMLTKDRAIRESARVFGSAVVEASNKARVDGLAGIELVRSPNVSRTVDGAEVFYACYEVYQLRQLPSYVGSTVNETAVVSSAGGNLITVRIPDPIIPIDTSRGFIRLNNSNATYPIVSSSGGTLTCSVPNNYELPPTQGVTAGNPVRLPFELIRPPVRRQSSLIEVPRGYVVNLNYSGPIDFGSLDSSDLTWTQFSLASGDAESSVFIIFDSQGGVDEIYPNGFGQPSFRPNGAIHFCIAPEDVKHTFAVGADFSDDMLDGEPSDVLDDPTVMWVTLNHLNGSVVVAENAVPITPAEADRATVAANKSQRLLEALAISGDRVSAGQ